MLGLDLVFFVLACLVLVQSSSFVVKSLSKIAEFFRINEFAVGFIIVAVSTSLPELFVGVTSAFSGNNELALGNVIGANIVNLTLIIGVISLLAKNIKIRSKVIRKDFIYMVAIVMLPLLLMWDKKLDWYDGLILIAVFVLYIWQMVKQEHRFKKAFDFVQKREMGRQIIIGLISLVVLMVSANFVVIFATKLSVDMNMPAILIGLILLGLGTSLPELILDSRAVLEKHQELAIGDTLGSVITNSTLVLGVSSLIHPIQTDVFLFFTSALFLVIIAFVFITFGESDRGISWKEGMSLLLLYVFFIIVQTYIAMLRSPAAG
jgi:cation:H+ antiporter